MILFNQKLTQNSPGFYLTFWQLSMYDLAPPTARYAEEGANLRSLSKQEDSKYIAADRSPDRTKRLTAATHRQRRDKFNLYANLLAEELKEQSASRSFTIKRLAREKLHWFSHGRSRRITQAFGRLNNFLSDKTNPARSIHH